MPGFVGKSGGPLGVRRGGWVVPALASSVESLTRAQQLSLPANTEVGSRYFITDLTPTPAVQELQAADTTEVAGFVSGCGTTSCIGIFTDEDDDGQFFLLGSTDVYAQELDPGQGNWRMRDDAGAGALYAVTNPTPGRTLWNPSNLWGVLSGDLPVPIVAAVTQDDLNSGCIVAGAGTSAANRSYYPSEPPSLGVPFYADVLGDATRGIINGGGSYYGIYDETGDLYGSVTFVAFPWSQPSWDVINGAGPAPTVTKSRPSGPNNWLTV